jgi:hypothetical protein
VCWGREKDIRVIAPFSALLRLTNTSSFVPQSDKFSEADLEIEVDFVRDHTPLNEDYCGCNDGLLQHSISFQSHRNEDAEVVRTLPIEGDHRFRSIREHAIGMQEALNLRETKWVRNFFEPYHPCQLPLYADSEEVRNRFLYRKRAAGRVLCLNESPKMLAAMSLFAGLSVSTSFISLNQRFNLNTSSAIMTSVRRFS